MLPTDPPFLPAVETIETSRLSIRIDTLENYIAAFRTLTDAALKARFGIVTDKDLEAQKTKVSGGLTTYRTCVVFFHLVVREGGLTIGSFAFHNWYPMHRRSEIGYAIASEQNKNKGYMREAISAIIAFGFREMGLNRIEAFIDPANMASRKLVERVGFREEGCLPDRYCYDDVMSDALVYGLLRKDCALANMTE